MGPQSSNFVRKFKFWNLEKPWPKKIKAMHIVIAIKYKEFLRCPKKEKLRNNPAIEPDWDKQPYTATLFIKQDN